MAAPKTALVFAAGLGTRMRPITETLPKPLVRVAGRSMLDHMLDRLAEAGVPRAVVNVHYLPDQIERQLVGRTEPAIVISDERALLLDQGGGIRQARPWLGDQPFVICNTDAIWIEQGRPALPALFADWDPDRMDVLLLVAEVARSIGVDWPGDFHRDGAGRLIKRAPDESSDFVYAGVGLIKATLFNGIDESVFKLAPFFFEAARQGRLFGTVLDGTWLHVGTPDAIAEAEAAFGTQPHSAGDGRLGALPR
jgi:N-acetyl-alpha-D-muramate 1-phosphate uridylyltransferase